MHDAYVQGMKAKRNQEEEADLELSSLENEPTPDEEAGPGRRRVGAMAQALGTMSAGVLGMTAGAFIGGSLDETLGKTFTDADDENRRRNPTR